MLLLLVSGARGSGFFQDTFENYTIVSTNVAEIGNDWNAAGTCIVAAHVGMTNSQGMNVGSGAIAWNTVNSNATPNWIWTDMRQSEADFMTVETLPPVITSTVFMVALVTNNSATHGCLYVVNPTNSAWEACLLNATNGPVPTVSTGDWVRISVFQNYSNHTATLFLDGVALRTNWPFINTNLTTYGNLVCEGGFNGNTFLDNVAVGTAVPAALTNSDINGNKMPDPLEYTLYGSLNVWTGSTITATATTVGGSLSPSGSVMRILYGDATNFVFTGNPGYVVANVLSNGVSLPGYSQAKSGNFNWSGIVTDGIFQVGFAYNGVRYVPGDYTTLTGALTSAQPGDTIIVSNGTYAESVTISSNLTLVGTNVTGLTSLVVQAGVTNTVEGFTNLTTTALTVVTNGVMVVSNSVLYVTSLTIQTNAIIHGYNSTAVVDGVQYTGTFTLDQYWNSTLVAQPLNLNQGFEAYAPGTRLDHLGYFGWNASIAGVTVVSNPESSTTNSSAQAAVVPPGAMVSNLVTGAGLVGGVGPTNVWVDLMWRETVHCDGPEFIATNSPLALYVNTNGWLTVLTPSGWDVCSNDLLGAAAPNLPAGTWAQISCLMNFATAAGKVSYFINGHLVRVSLPFANPATHITGVKVVAEDATAWLDNVNIQTDVPAGMTNLWGAASDRDHDGRADAAELAQWGRLDYFPAGSVFTIR